MYERIYTPACILLQVLAPSHRALVLFWSVYQKKGHALNEHLRPTPYINEELQASGGYGRGVCSHVCKSHKSFRTE